MRKLQSKTGKRAAERTPMDAALLYLGPSARTVREVERKLDSLHFGEMEIAAVIERLEENGLLSDAVYCADFVDSRLRTKPVSRRHLREQLLQHEANLDAIEEALARIDDETEMENARAVAEKFARQFADLDKEERIRRVEKRLVSRGYGYDVSRNAAEAAVEAFTYEEDAR